MNEVDLDRSYTALAEALGEAGEAQAPLLLSMLCLALIGRAATAGDVLPLISRARKLALEAPARQYP